MLPQDKAREHRTALRPRPLSAARGARPAQGWTTQAVGQQHTSPSRARCEARRREVAVICGCGNGLARDAPGASKVDGGLRAGGPFGLDWATCAIGQQLTSPLRARCEARRREVAVICGCGSGLARDAPVASKVNDGRDPADPAGVRCMQPLEGLDLESHAIAR